MSNTKQYEMRMKRVQDAIELKEPDMVPMLPLVAGVPYHLYNIGASHSTDFYDYEKSAEAFIKYHEEFQPDFRMIPSAQSGKINELAQSTMLDWPGRPGTAVPDFSPHQVLEYEYMLQDEYDELISDYSGFIFRKFIPRAYPGLKGFAHLDVDPSSMLGANTFTPMFQDDVRDAMQTFIEMIDENKKYVQSVIALSNKLDEMGFPPFYTGKGQVPYDIISDYLRGTLGTFDDLLEIPDKIAQANDLFVDIQIKNWKHFEKSPMRVKRIFFPLHKGMDGFMSPKQYDELYWEPYQRMLKYLISIGVTPFIYTEGAYDSRVDYLCERLSELPQGSCVIHFEKGDFAQLKKKFSNIACLMGGMPIYLLEYGTKEQVIDRVKYLIDHCAAGGGYLFNVNATAEKVKRENFEAMFDTARTYGKK
ncbi:MAG: hypothetical protein FWC75_05555 [Oscillospiraceae bacterium]|nr:hypothetical protein [Oscillospiraceae bacterium]